jgi:hypothetical protein
MTDETTFADLVDEFITNYETELNITVPSQRRAFLRVLAVQQATVLKGLIKRVTAAKKAVFATTAGADGLAAIATEFGVPRTAAVKYKATCEVTASGGTSVTAGAQMTSEASGAYYTIDANASESGGKITFAVTAEDAGEDANLEIAVRALTFVSPISGVNSAADITDVDVYGEDEEDLEAWRARVLEAERAAYGGGNTADYRYWAEQVSGVERAYPYSGKPITWYDTSNLVSFVAATNTISRGASVITGTLGTLGVGDMIEISGSTSNDGFYTVQSYTGGVANAYDITVVEALSDEAAGDTVTVTNQSLPGDRTVYVEAVGANPVPATPLLNSVRAAINYGTDDIYQPALGDIDSTLYVEAVEVAEFFVEVINLVVATELADACKAKVVEDLGTYFDRCRPFIEGLDFEMDRNDIVTEPTISRVIQGVLESFSASADGVRFSVGSAGSEQIPSYQLNQGEIASLSLVYSDDDPDWSA